MVKKLYFIIIIMFCLTVSSNAAEKNNNDTFIRKPVVAGQFYPDDPSQLKKIISSYLENARRTVEEKPIAIISPHAGYIFCGQIMADAFKQTEGNDYDLIVLLGTNHTTPNFSGISVYAKGGFETPLGISIIDEETAKKLLEKDKSFVFDQKVHEKEHSIEVILPFAATLFPKVKILPIIVGSSDLDIISKFGTVLAEVLSNKRPLIVASSDFSHYPDYNLANKVDKSILSAIKDLDPILLQKQIKKEMESNQGKLDTCACGEAPIMAAMSASKQLGANCGKLISYANSGDVSIGNKSKVVGYGAVAMIKTNSGELNDNHKKALLTFARKNIEQFLTSKTTPLAKGFDPILEKKQGAFVTLKKKEGELRGCIGHMAEDMPLCQVVGAMALQAAFNDFRFNPLKLSELSEIEIEISVLTPFKEVKSVSDIQIGRDGLLIKKGGNSAVFLPQVATEQGWKKEEMLEHLCRKAGMEKDCWKTDAQFFTFQAIIFKE